MVGALPGARVAGEDVVVLEVAVLGRVRRHRVDEPPVLDDREAAEVLLVAGGDEGLRGELGALDQRREHLAGGRVGLAARGEAGGCVPRRLLAEVVAAAVDRGHGHEARETRRRRRLLAGADRRDRLGDRLDQGAAFARDEREERRDREDVLEVHDEVVLLRVADELAELAFGLAVEPDAEDLLGHAGGALRARLHERDDARRVEELGVFDRERLALRRNEGPAGRLGEERFDFLVGRGRDDLRRVRLHVVRSLHDGR